MSPTRTRNSRSCVRLRLSGRPKNVELRHQLPTTKPPSWRSMTTMTLFHRPPGTTHITAFLANGPSSESETRSHNMRPDHWTPRSPIYDHTRVCVPSEPNSKSMMEYEDSSLLLTTKISLYRSTTLDTYPTQAEQAALRAPCLSRQRQPNDKTLSSGSVFQNQN
jgi:hypothetical protein